MSAAFDDFLAGRGRLAGRLAALPPFEPPPGMEARVLAALDRAAAPAGFDPPASLEAAVMAEAARLDAAQGPRRAAVLDQLARGASADAALGAPVSPATAAWLRQLPHPAAPLPPPRRRRWPWLAGLGSALTAALAVSVALRMVQAPAEPPVMPASAVPDTLADASVAAPPPVSARTAPAAPAREVAKRRADAPPARAQQTPRVAHETRGPAGVAAMAAEVAAAASPAQAKAQSSVAGIGAARMLPAPAGRAPDATIEAALDTPPPALAARLLAHPPQRWTLHVATADAVAGKALRAALAAQLDAAGRNDRIDLQTAPLPPGRVRLSAAATR